jgi:hypothetical protein
MTSSSPSWVLVAIQTWRGAHWRRSVTARGELRRDGNIEFQAAGHRKLVAFQAQRESAQRLLRSARQSA